MHGDVAGSLRAALTWTSAARLFREVVVVLPDLSFCHARRDPDTAREFWRLLEVG